MAETTISVAASGDDGYAAKEGTTSEWPPSGTSTFVSDTATNILVRKAKFAAFSDLVVALVRFDTSVLADDIPVAGAVLRMVPIANGLTTRNLQVEYYPSSNWPIDITDWIGTAEGTNAGVFPISGLALDVPTDFVLTNPENISRTGYTGLRLTLSGGQPAADADDHRIEFASFDHATLAEPQLIVTVAATPTYQQHPKFLLAERMTV
jgi:hypothetical protein